MAGRERTSKIHEVRYPLCHSRGTSEKQDLLDPPRYFPRSGGFRGKALSFGVLDWKQLDIKGAETAASSLELDLSTGVVKTLELDSKPQAAVANISRNRRNDSFSVRSHDHSGTMETDAVKRMDEKERLSSSSSPVKVNQNSVEKPGLLDQKIPTKKGRDASPNRRFSFSFSRSRSYKESSSAKSGPLTSSVPASHASAKSGPLTFNGHSRTRSGPVLKPKTETNVSSNPTTVHALLQFTLRKGINLFQFVVENNNNVLAATMKSSDSRTRSYTLYSVKQVTKKGDSWLGRHRNEEKNLPFAHTVIGQMKTVTSITARTYRSESVLFGVETNQELAAIVQTSNTTTIIFPSGVHTLPKDGNAPLSLIERWKSGGACDCGGWDIGCKLRVLYCDDHTTKPHTFSSFQLFEQERDQPAFKMVNHDDALHSVEFGSTISLLEAFFISLAVRSHQSLCEVLIGDGPLKRETSAKYASNPPVSPIGRV